MCLVPDREGGGAAGLNRFGASHIVALKLKLELDSESKAREEGGHCCSDEITLGERT